MNYFFTLLILLYCWVLINSPTPIGYDVSCQFTIAMWYNNLGFVSVGLLIILISSRKLNQLSLSEAIIEGLLLSVIFTNKFQFFIFIAIPYLIITIRDINKKNALKYFLLAALTFFILTPVQFIFVHSSVFAYISEIIEMISKSEYSLLRLFYYWYIFIDNYYMIYVLIISVLIILLVKNKYFSIKVLYIFFAFISLLMNKMACGFHNYTYEIPFLAVLPLLLLPEKFKFPSDKLKYGIFLFIAIPFIVALKDTTLSYRYMLRKNKEINLYFLYPPRVLWDYDTDENLNDSICPELIKNVEEVGYKNFVCDALDLLNKIENQESRTLFVCNTQDPVTMYTNFKYPKNTYTWFPLDKPIVSDYFCDKNIINQSDIILLRNDDESRKVMDCIKIFDSDAVWNQYANVNWILLERL